ncbi:hypothetical protein WEN_03020 [Mycoplasma wenyonii str. Massachusetts]|uniref:Uncharacterized protein n=1 Tax=Mycoplasma wenyonii (strain Massachusetts) TaxID=1197325 RepID=I6ZFJ4_MYCWM|nr:hypothetical protein [Mycoplasma wenyonii]AFN65387.1 hypothetical protein WEN_03020 [Mycoplasma wenyonii str. Massachusetts]
MSALTRAFQFFSGLGLVSTTPFAVKFASKQEVTVRGMPRLVSYEETVEKQEVTPSQPLKSTEVMGEAQKMMDEVSGGGNKQCFWWPEVKGLELLACVYSNKLDRVFLFHWDSRNQLKLQKQLNQISSFSYSSTGALMRLKDNESVKMTGYVKLVLAWLHKWGTELIPEQHCKLTNNAGKNNYTLTCDSETKVSGGKKLEKTVSLESLHSNRYKAQIQQQ